MSCLNPEQNDIGIAKIEAFLDLIEDTDDEILDSFQDRYIQFLSAGSHNNLEEEEEHGSEEFFMNKSKIQSLKECQEVIKPGKVASDGFEDCYYRGGLDSCYRPDGEGTLVYNNMDSFSGMFDHGIRNRTGVRTFSGGDVAKIEGTWREGFLEGRARTDFSAGGYLEGFYHQGVLHGAVRQFGIGCYLQHFSFYQRGVRMGWVYQGIYIYLSTYRVSPNKKIAEV